MDVLHNPFFYIISINFNSLVPVRKKSIYSLYVPVSILHLKPLHHFFSNTVIIPKPFPMDCTSEGSKEEDIWGTNILAEWWVGKNSPSEFCDCFPFFKLVCGFALSGWRISSAFLWGWTLLKCLWKVLTVQIWVYGSTTWQQNTEAMSEQLLLLAGQSNVCHWALLGLS
jgi:hypothetical protein